ncbi:MAG: hypothetical protein AB7N24_03915 [Dehalococcoidia bacterium]
MSHAIGFGRVHGASGPRARPVEVSIQLGWFAAIGAVAFVVPFVFSSILEFQHDAYYLTYFAVVLAVLGAYVVANEIDLVEFIQRGWKLSLVVGAAATAFVVWSVLARLDSTPHPHGIYFAFEIAWRGLAYGVVDALLLSAFPGLIAWRVMHGDLAGLRRRVAYGALTLALVMTITAVYHLGYEDLRNADGIRNPEIGNTVISLPVIISANPIGSLVAHTSMHVAAVTHAYESKDRLPPQTFVD